MEIVSTEETYVSHLDTCMSLFVRPMMADLQAAEDEDSSEKYHLTQVGVACVLNSDFYSVCIYS